MKEKFLKTIKKFNLIEQGDGIVVGVSGGPDSIALLNLLNELKNKKNIRIYVAHINHMIRKEADIETEYVQKMCENLEIECFVKKVDVIEKAKSEKIGTEEAGRNIRYEFFNEILKKTNSNKIATAHNANDNAETVLMNIIRGSSTQGLKGIEPNRQGKYIRPLIECSRDEIEKYCKENNLNPKIDSSNKENIYTRNKVRNLLIPYIQKEFNPNIIECINRLSEIAKNENKYFENLAMQKFEHILIKQSNNELILDLKKFNLIEDVIKPRIIFIAIEKTIGNVQGIEKVHIEDIIKLCRNNIGNKYLCPNKKIKIYVKRGQILFIQQKNSEI